MKVLVTGGAGYIGSHACKALAEAGHEPITYDNLSTGHGWAVRWGPLEVGDILDPARLAEVFARHAPDAVMHFASRIFVGESVTDPAIYHRTNVVGTLNLLDATRAAGVRRFVFSSSCAAYGIPEKSPIALDAPQWPVNPYGWTKLLGERMLADYCAAYGLGGVALRYFNAAGADPGGMIGEDHDPETHLIPLALDAASGRRPHLDLLGDDYATPDGTCIRDYVHVCDLADAHVRALDACEPGIMRAANLGVGRGSSVREVIDSVQRVTGFEVPIRMAARRPGDAPALVADPSSARHLLEWVPQWTQLDAIVESAWNWHRRLHRLDDNPTRRARSR
jgi:UDP-glucose-4-epimerase GalE